jgi:hypothetical protein
MYFNKYLKYKIKYINLLIKKGGGNENMTNISCKINKNNKLKIDDKKYKNYDIFECLEKNNYLNELEDKNEKNEKIKKIFIENEENLLEKLATNTTKENKLKKDIRDLNILVKKNNINEKKLLDEKNKNKKLNEQILKKQNDYENIRNQLLIIFDKVNMNEKDKYSAIVTGLRLKIQELSKQIDDSNKGWSDYTTHIIETNSKAENKQNMKRLELEKELNKLKVKLQENEKVLKDLKPVDLPMSHHLKKTILIEQKNLYLEAIKKKLEHCDDPNGCTRKLINLFNNRLHKINRLHNMKLKINLYDFFYKRTGSDKYFLKFDYIKILEMIKLKMI